MKHPRSNDRACVGRSGDRVGANQGFKIDGLPRRAGDAQSLLESLPVGGILQKKSRGFGALFLQSLKDENAAAAVGKRQQRDGRVVLARAAGEDQPMISFLLAGSGMQVHEELWALAHHALAFLKVKLVLEIGDPWIGAGAADKNKTALLKIPWPQFSRRANHEPVVRVAS